MKTVRRQRHRGSNPLLSAKIPSCDLILQEGFALRRILAAVGVLQRSAVFTMRRKCDRIIARIFAAG